MLVFVCFISRNANKTIIVDFEGYAHFHMALYLTVMYVPTPQYFYLHLLSTVTLQISLLVMYKILVLDFFCAVGGPETLC